MSASTCYSSMINGVFSNNDVGKDDNAVDGDNEECLLMTQVNLKFGYIQRTFVVR